MKIRRWSVMLALVLATLTAQARWLDVNKGRFQTRDSYEGNTEKPKSLNKYTYAENDPVNGVDPDGKSRVDITINDGRVTTLDNPSNEDFREYIKLLVAEGTITDISIVGHGWVDAMILGAGTSGDGIYLDDDNRVLFDDDESSFADFVRNKLASGATIRLRGCLTAGRRIWTGRPNICAALARELPGTTVIGSATWRVGLVEPHVPFLSEVNLYTGSRIGVTLPRSYSYPLPMPRISNIQFNHVFGLSISP